MSATIDFYVAQAGKCRADADASPLTQVRDRNLRAAAAWQAMADKLLHSEILLGGTDLRIGYVLTDGGTARGAAAGRRPFGAPITLSNV